MLPITAESIFVKVRALMNDNDGAVYTDAVILPYFGLAYDDLRNECEDYNIPITNETSDAIKITAGVTDIGGSTGPALPKNLVEILSMYERLHGTNDNFMLMDRRQFLPEINVQTSYLQYWSWENQKVKLLGATSNVDIRLHYIADNFGQIVNEDTPIRLFNSRNFLSFRTAGLCSQFIAENPERATECNKNADRTLETLLSILVKTQQSIRTRRRPFMARYKSNGGNSYR